MIGLVVKIVITLELHLNTRQAGVFTLDNIIWRSNMTIQIKDKSFRSNLKVNDILITVENDYYIVVENERAGYSYKLSNLLTHQTKRNLQTLNKQITRNGHVLGIGYLKKIIDSKEYKLTMNIVYKKTSR